ncbi:MAG: sensor histidine kinase [Porphyrobacter sp.]|jgi:signal transduction histidine kinase|nr:sensor histidine kinase [Porphyrobacter sp.]
MLFDDRLATVLRINTTSEAGRRTQLRQLLDLLGSRSQPLHSHEGVREQSLLAAAWLRMDALAEAIPAADRAAIIREPGWRFRSAELVAYLADDEPEIAAAALTRADLSSAQWEALIPQLPIRARGFLRLRRDLPLGVEAMLDRLGVHDRGLPAPQVEEAAPALVAAAVPVAAPAPSDAAPSDAAPPDAASQEPKPAPEPVAAPQAEPVGIVPDSAVIPLRAPAKREPEHAFAPPIPVSADREHDERSEISALVERIAQFRRERSEAAEDLELSPRLPLGEVAEPARRTALAFGFVADASGRITWASSEWAAMVIGTRLLRSVGSGMMGAGDNGAIARAFARRQPICQAPLTLQGAPAIAGEWLVDGEPQFSAEGHFAGYVGRFRRAAPSADTATTAAAEEADRMRQLLHELRTPITAVQGYAEVIQQQLFGPAPHEYRALAAAIAADAAHILAGFDELDRLARLETGALDIAPGEADLPALVRRMTQQLAPVLAGRDASLTLTENPSPTLLLAIDEDEAEALLWRLLATLAGHCAPDEALAITLTPVFDGPAAMAQCVCDLPKRLAILDDPFACDLRPAHQTISAGPFGPGFALRLARAEARRAGGVLALAQGKAVLRLPLFAGAETNRKAVLG